MSQLSADQIKEETDETLKALDWIVVVDHSGSMAEDSTRLAGKTRYEELQEEVIAVARQAEKYDDDGITVINFASTVNVTDGVTASEVTRVFKEFPPRGLTDLAGAIKAVAKKTRESTKPGVVAIIYTDGVPNDENAVIKEVNAAAAEFGRPRIGFVIIQVGQDKQATKFLARLDDTLKVDVLSTIPEEQSEGLTLGQLAWLARNA